MMIVGIKEAVQILRQGGLVAFPTETVYGLGADASNPTALLKIFKAKGRPVDHPLIVHVADLSQLSVWVRDVSEDAKKLMQAFWPGPLTLVFKKAPQVNDLITGGQDTIGLRIPHHPFALELLKAYGGGLAAPSANRFGRISPTTAAAVIEELGDNIEGVIDGGPCEVGLESTIVDVSGEHPVLLRPGMITVKQLERVLGKSILSSKKDSPRVSGSLASHYSPMTPTRLISADKLSEFLKTSDKKPIALLGSNLCYMPGQTELTCSVDLTPIPMPNDAIQYAHDLYQTLRDVDKQGFKEIVIVSVPEGIEWDAIRDRLQRAAMSS